MEIESRPSKISRIAGKSASTRHENGLEHEQGLVSGLNHIISCGFTLMQLQELQQQAIIYKYMEAGFPIPFHLILPIWKSVTSLSRCQLYPSLLGYGALNTTSLDHEPGRCRRTDGKRWRCKKGVVTGHKYCERHMHRNRDSDGPQRSRKQDKTLTNSRSNFDCVEANLSVSSPTDGNIRSEK